MDYATDIDRLTPICFVLLGVCLASALAANAVARRTVLNGGLLYLFVAAVWFVARLSRIFDIPTDDPGLHAELTGRLCGAFLFPTLAAVWLGARGFRAGGGATHPNRNALIVGGVVILAFAWMVRYAEPRPLSKAGARMSPAATTSTTQLSA